VVRNVYSFAKWFARISQTAFSDIAPRWMGDALFGNEARRLANSANAVYPGTIYPVPSAIADGTATVGRVAPHYLYNMHALANFWLPLAGPLEEIAEFRELDRKVMILCSSRTGSEYFSYLLEDFGLKVYESFNVVMDIHTRRVPRDLPTLRDYVLAVIQECTTGGLFGVKGTTESALPLFIYGEWPKYAREWKIIRIQRRNVVRQAISLLIAEKTEAWHPGQVPKREVSDSEYSFAEILNAVERIVDVNNHVDRIVTLLGVDAMSVFYEDLQADARGIMDTAGRYLELDRISTKALDGQGSTRPRPKVQSTDLNKVWEQRFRHELASRTALGPARAEAA
jgi:hypothetical protein